MPLPSQLPDDFNVTAAETSSKLLVWAKRYVILKKIGSGNFGNAFLIEDKEARKIDEKQKVLKQVCVGPVDPGETVDAMREARLLARMKHKNIVQFHESFLDGQFFCIVLEYCEGGDMEGKITEHKEKNEHINEQQVIKWLKQILKAIRHMHESRVLHRDLKSRNIFLKNNQIKIGDFGISRILMGESDKASTFVGTPYYMSPEVLKHEKYDEKCDIWSLGCVLYEICCFNHAFDGSSLMAVMFKIVSEFNPTLPEVYSRALNNILERFLHREPQKRPTAKEILEHPLFVKQKTSVIQSEQHLTARQRLKLKKQIEADKKMQQLKEMTRQNFEQKGKIRRESKERNFSRSSFNNSMELNGSVLKSSSHMIPHDHDETLRENHEDELHGTVVFQTVKSSHTLQDNLISPMDSENTIQSKTPPDPHMSSTDELVATLLRDGIIPEDGDLADTFYSSHDDFEEASSSSSCSEELPEDILSDTEYRDMVGWMEDALFLEESTSRMTTRASFDKKNKNDEIKHVFHHDDQPVTSHFNNKEYFPGSITAKPKQVHQEIPVRPNTSIGPLSSFNTSVAEQRIFNFRQRCVSKLGEDVFAKAYEIAKEIRFDVSGENSIRRKLAELVPDSSKCMDLEQLVFLEQERNHGL
ncbi:serine/threonine-protein kinase Nek11-like isoform X1 [Ciona intestinalis]